MSRCASRACSATASRRRCCCSTKRCGRWRRGAKAPSGTRWRRSGRRLRLASSARRRGAYGAGLETLLGDASRDAIGQAYLDASSTAYAGAGIASGRPDAGGFAARVFASQALLHQQDHAETDLLRTVRTTRRTRAVLLQRAALLGATPALYHADSSRPGAPRLRHVAEEVARCRARPAGQPGLDRRHDATRVSRRRRDRPRRRRAARITGARCRRGSIASTTSCSPPRWAIPRWMASCTAAIRRHGRTFVGACWTRSRADCGSRASTA